MGLILLRIFGLWMLITGLLIWINSADQIIDSDPEYALISFVLSFGIGYMLLWRILGTIRGTGLEYWVRTNLNPWTAFAIGIGIYVLYIVGMSLTA